MAARPRAGTTPPISSPPHNPDAAACLKPAVEAKPEPSPHYFPRRFGFGIRSVTAIVLGVAIVVIASIVWLKPFAAGTVAKPQGPEPTAAPAAP